MFGFLKEKLKKLIHKKSEDIIEESEEKKEKKIEAKEAPIKEAPTEIKESIKEYESDEKKEKREEKIKELEEEERKEEREEKKQGFFSRLAKGFSSMKLQDDAFEEFFKEEILIENNVALAAIDALKIKLKGELIGKEIKKKEVENKIKEALKKSMMDLMINPFNLEDMIKERIKDKDKRPFVIVFFGINGSGKTTSISKVAFMLKKHFSVVLAAADTFRAASIEQLEKHADKLKVEVIKSKYGADPASVIFDAIKHAKAKGIDVVLADTAERAEEINIEIVEAARRKAEELMKQKHLNDVEYTALAAQMERELARLRVARKHRSHHAGFEGLKHE